MKKIIINCQNCNNVVTYNSIEKVRIDIDKECSICKEPLFGLPEYNYLKSKIEFYEIIKDFDKSEIDTIIEQILKFKK